MSTPRNILVATDFGEASQEALTYAFGLAAGRAAKVHVVHVVSVQAMLDAHSPEHEPLEDAETWAQRKLGELCKPYEASGNVGEIQTPIGDAATEILKLAQTLPADLVVVGAHGRSPLRGLLPGSVAGRVYRQASCPVIVLQRDHRPAAAQGAHAAA